MKQTEQQIEKSAKFLGMMACCIAEAMEVKCCTLTLNWDKSAMIVMGGDSKLVKEDTQRMLEDNQKHLALLSQEISKEEVKLDEKVYVKRIVKGSFDKNWKSISDPEDGADNLQTF